MILWYYWELKTTEINEYNYALIRWKTLQRRDFFFLTLEHSTVTKSSAMYNLRTKNLKKSETLLDTFIVNLKNYIIHWEVLYVYCRIKHRIVLISLGDIQITSILYMQGKREGGQLPRGSTIRGNANVPGRSYHQKPGQSWSQQTR